MAYEFKLPDLGEGLTEGEIARWLVSEGQVIAEDDPLVEVQTDKTTVEIPSPAAGVVSKLLAGEGDVVPVGTVIVVIGGDGVPEGTVPEPAERPASRPRADGAKVRTTPLVRRLAQELGVDLETVEPSGPGGRVTEADVRAASGEASPVTVSGTERREPLRGVRRVIAEHMTKAQSIPAVTWVEECDFGRVDLKTLLPTVLKAVAGSLRAFPELNARFEGDAIVLLDRYDLGVAIDTDQGLVVPVVRDCDSRSIEEIDAEVQRLAEAARAGTLKPEELRGSTFTVTSAGRLGGLFATPLVNHPEVAILGLHRIAERPAVRNGVLAVREVGWLSCTFDHRVIDGARASEFLLGVIARLESLP
ncbi:MAG TPA: dihydrolipoamide acetyltransferase family protein [Gaiellaceae bacterium]|nr:dihydrolipoamide acetyltransferase family protein [Gaiellaceae bacterium]